MKIVITAKTIVISAISFFIVIALSLIVFYLNRPSVILSVADNIEVIRISSGGKPGMNGDGNNLSIKDGQITYKSQKKSLTMEQQKTIVKKINNARFFDLKSEYNCDGCLDVTRNHITISDKKRFKIVEFDNYFANTPSGLEELDEYLTSLTK